MKKKSISTFLLVFLLIGMLMASKPIEKPNILLILVDDLGYSDLGCYGSEISTPNIDSLGENGIIFTQFYNSARSCPSRASLLTGLFPHQTGIGSFIGPNRGVPGYAGRLNSNTVTLAEVLKKNGYRTFGSGKWHVNHPGPIERGFDEYYGFLDDYGIDGWESKWMQRFPDDKPERKYREGEYFATNAITDYALDFLNLSDSTPDHPWFLYLSYQAVHFPLQAPKEDIEKYKNTYKVGWDTIRTQRLERMKKIGVVEKNINLSERSEIPLPNISQRNGVPGNGIHNPPWNILEEDRKLDLARRMAVFAGMLDNMDQNIGRVIDYLKDKRQLDNTLVLFMSDNGACAEWDPFGFEYPNYDDRITGGTPSHPNILHTGEDLEKLGGPDGPLFSYGSAWANVGNTPFTLYKQYVHEGGISSPLIIYWPAKIKESQIFKDYYAHFVDVMATLVDVTGSIYPEKLNGNKISPMEGISLFKTLTGNVPKNRLLSFEHQGFPAVRKGDWKLVSRNQNTMSKTGFTEEAEFELYNIAEDRSETNDLASDFPEKVAKLKQLMFNEFNRIKVFPKPSKY